MFGGLPLRFVRAHKGRVDYLPLRRTADGEVVPQELRVVCACGWEGTPSTSQVAAGAEHQDHVWQEWNTEHGH